MQSYSDSDSDSDVEIRKRAETTEVGAKTAAKVKRFPEEDYDDYEDETHPSRATIRRHKAKRFPDEDEDSGEEKAPSAPSTPTKYVRIALPVCLFSKTLL